MTDPATTPSELELEARGPHLPDTVTRLGFPFWFFLLLAFARLVWLVRDSPPGNPTDPGQLISYVASIIPSVAVVLFPAALFLRHPDATVRARTLVFGLLLFVIVEGMRVLSPPLQPIFEQLTPGSEETPFLVPLALVYNAAIGILGSFAVANIGLGLATARRYEDAPGVQVLQMALVMAVSVVAVGGVLSVSQLPLDEIPMTPTVVLYLASTVILSVLFATAWAYVAAVTIRGARAGELPEHAWTTMAVGSGLIIAAYAIRSILFIFRPGPDTQPLLIALNAWLSIGVAAGYLGLLLGLFLGLPSLSGDEPDDESDSDVVDDEETDLRLDDLVVGEAPTDRRDPAVEPA